MTPSTKLFFSFLFLHPIALPNWLIRKLEEQKPEQDTKKRKATAYQKQKKLSHTLNQEIFQSSLAQTSLRLLKAVLGLKFYKN